LELELEFLITLRHGNSGEVDVLVVTSVSLW